ncbi:adenylate/guanylate cyclase domain-containing protein [Marinitenerispora sediminis]|uniref:Adenylate/guanylate cyclase domain-containing protein n=1 Tax=Marinitenerispora sediminis TaxID=1931232 RepID=A0A368T8V2_9ACTN|nr:adenylate/guanylate cyclase domain-containing protein [Marinitenerispora sediminis]RCV54299.1 adenylate/guanylate cyclase domain-containing protein [Marinitenerispora sediminis]RCV60528.1 adenylate/guanylate cyclase domain-containing protein [Marinitenerispora sediminis]RCV61080.1 adenylate/guanylate cyclase domain-containing protein [Marinitenerispora sediminis]
MSSRPDPKEIEAALLGGEARYTRAEAVRRSGADPEFVTRVWRALGFATRGEDVVAFTDSDVEALRATAELLRHKVLDEEAAVRLARAMGQTMARLAEWQTSILTTLSYAPQTVAEHEQLGPLVGLTKELLPDVERLLTHIWRRQLAASATRTLAVIENSEDAAPNYFPLVVGFADLVSFTTLSRELDEVGLAEVVEGFEATSADIVAAGGGRVVKTLGDEILYVTNSARQAAEIALQLADGVKTHVEVPDVRVGLAYGPVLALLGDVFGTTVNRASRLTSFARPGTVLIDDALAGLLTDEDPFQVVPVRPRHAHGLGQLQPHALRRAFEPQVRGGAG